MLFAFAPLVGHAHASSLNDVPLVTFNAQTSAFSLDASHLAVDDSGQGAISYQWILTDAPTGSAAVITDSAAPRTILSADIDGAYTIELQMLVDGVAQSPVIFSASTLNVAPIASIDIVAGAAPVAIGSPVALSAASSFDPDGNRLNFAWAITSAPAGSSVSLANSSEAINSFTPDIEGTYLVSLVSTDEAGLSASQTVELTVGEGVVVANAGSAVSAALNNTVLLDGFASTHSAGEEIVANWSLISAPSGSVAQIVEGRDLDPEQPGRIGFTPDVAGDYVLNLSAASGGQTDYDRIVISAGVDANSAPVADAGKAAQLNVGSAMELDGTGSTDIDGDLLSYAWSIVSAPDGSFATLVDPSSPKATLMSDVAGDYIVQLAVSDGDLIAYDTVRVSSNEISPIADAGVDTLLPGDFVATLDGTASTSGNGAAYGWSLLGLTGNNASSIGSIADATLPLTSVDLAIDTSDADSGPAQALQDYNLIVFKNSNSRSQVYGRAFIGENLTGQSSDYANQLPGYLGTDVLVVGGHINGNPKNINNGGNIRVGGQVNAHVNMNGGGQIIQDSSVSIANTESDIRAFSTYLKNLAPTGEISIPQSQPGPVTITAIPSADGIAVIDVSSGSDLFDNNKVQQIDVNVNGAKALVINVGGSNVKLRQANFVGNANNDDVRSKLIWNFHTASNILTERHLSGSLIAPNAQLQNRSPIYGSVAVRSINHRAAIHMPGFAAANAFTAQPEPLDSVVAQIKVSQNGLDAFDTVLITDSNIAPLATITSAENIVEIGQNVVLDASASTDANADILAYQWSLIAKPMASTAVLSATNASATIVPDTRGIYIAQLVVSDGALNSAPATFVFSVANQAPQIISSPVEIGIAGEEYLYQAQASDADGDTLNWSLTNAPDGMNIDASTGLISWQPTDIGTYDVALSVEDGFGGSADQAFSIVVEPGNLLTPPSLEQPADVTLRPGESIAFTISGNDAGGDTLTYWSQSLPAGASLDAVSGAFSFTADANAPANYPVTITVTDGIQTASATFSINVEPWPYADPTLLSGIVLDAQDYANGVSTPVVGATVNIGSLTAVTDTAGAFAFTVGDDALLGTQQLSVVGASATQPPSGNTYGNASEVVTIFANAPNVLANPILLNSFGDDEVLVTVVEDELPADLRACRIEQAENASGSDIDLSSLNLTASEPLTAGTQMTVWAKAPDAEAYAPIASGSIAADGTTLENIAGTLV